MNATLILCDAAQVSEGKLFILGGGWAVTGPNPSPMALALKIDVDWQEAQQAHHWELYLQDMAGNPVTVDTPDGPQPLEIRGDFQIGTPQGVPLGSTIPVNLAINLGPVPLPPGGRYRWSLSINGETAEDWAAEFSTLVAAAGGSNQVPQPEV